MPRLARALLDWQFVLKRRLFIEVEREAVKGLPRADDDGRWLMVMPPFSAKKVVWLLMLKVQKRVRGGILLANYYNFVCTFFFPTHRTNAALEGQKGQRKVPVS